MACLLVNYSKALKGQMHLPSQSPSPSDVVFLCLALRPMSFRRELFCPEMPVCFGKAQNYSFVFKLRTTVTFVQR